MARCKIDSSLNKCGSTVSCGVCRHYEKDAPDTVEKTVTSYNSAMPKLPGIFNVETYVLNIHHDCSINERERIAGIVRECYDYIAGQLRQ